MNGRRRGIIVALGATLFLSTPARALGPVDVEAAAKAGELPPKFKRDEVAEFILSSMQGAMLLGRSQRNLAPLRHFEDILFSKVLR